MGRHDFRNALVCAAVVAGAFLIVNPFVNMPFDDDWAYSFTVRQFLATGHITYDGWSAPLIVTHALWGAMFSKLFGYSFITLRFSTLPLDIGVAVFSYLLARAGQLRPAAAICLSLTLCLSPIFLPLAVSFMTDVPALCYILISLYALMRAGKAEAFRPAVIWLAGGVLVGIFGGMGRQTVWIAPLCVIPYLIVIRRSSLPFVVCAFFAWLVVVLDIIICLRWFKRQPDIYYDPSPAECLRNGLRYPGIFLTNMIMVAFTTVMFTLPAAMPFTVDALRRLWRERNSWRSALTAVVVLGLSAGMAARPAFGMAPWLFNIVTIKGVIGALELSGSRPTVLPLIIRGIISGLVLMTTYFLAARSIELAVDFRQSFVRLRHFFATADVRPILAIFVIAYSGLMVIRAAQDQVFDRYSLPLIPILAVFLLRGRSLALAWPLLAIYCIYAVASTQDNLALSAARREAVNRLEAHGVPRTEIAGGFEYDFYTQLEESGRINRYGITNPTRPCYYFVGLNPALKCRYRLEFPRSSDTEASKFGQIDYVSWLPPFHRTVYIDRFKYPWWLSSNKPANAIVPLNFERDYDN